MAIYTTFDVPERELGIRVLEIVGHIEYIIWTSSRHGGISWYSCDIVGMVAQIRGIVLYFFCRHMTPVAYM